MSLIDLLIVQPGETLGGVWWTYTAYHGPIAAGIYRPQDSMTFIGMTLRQVGQPIPDPLVNASGDWLWWEPMAWQTAAAGSTDYVWLYQAWGPREARKVESMRKAPAGADSSLSVHIRTDDASASDAFVNECHYQVAVSALIILPA